MEFFFHHGDGIAIPLNAEPQDHGYAIAPTKARLWNILSTTTAFANAKCVIPRGGGCEKKKSVVFFLFLKEKSWLVNLPPPGHVPPPEIRA